MSYYTYSDPSYTTYVTASTASLGVGMLIFDLIVLALCIVSIVAIWKMYKKAGEHGWACIVPFYNNFCFFRMAWGNGWMFIAPLAASLISGIACVCMVFGIIVGNAVVSFGMFFVIAAALITEFVIYIMAIHKLSKAFGHGVGFTLGLLFLPIIFYIILGFGSSKYVGPSAKNAIELM